MSGTANEARSVGSNADAFPKPEPKLLRPHLFAHHDLIPLNKPDAIRHGKPVGKAPLDVRWPKRDYSRSDPASWMARGHNVGVRLHDDQLVIDADPRHFEGADRLARLCERFGIRIDDYPRVLSGGGGQHIYMAKPRELRIVGKLSEFPGIEFKTKGTQLVAAGSVHPDSHEHYRADDPFGDLAAPAMAPESLLRAIERKEQPLGSLTPAQLTPHELTEMLTVLDPTKFRNYDDWLKLMMACHHATGGEGVEEFASWSARDPNYASRAAETRKTWGSLNCNRSDGVTVGTLFKAVTDAGYGELVQAMTRTPADQDFDDAPEIVQPNPIRRPRFVELSLEDLSDMAAPRWLVEHLIPEGGLAVVYGQPKACKTFWAIDLSLSVACGRAFHGQGVRAGRVTYVAAEGGPARLGDRAKAWLKARGVNQTAARSWRMFAERIDVRDPVEVAKFVALLAGPRDLIIIDTLARCMSGDENNQKDMGAFIAGCDRIREVTGAAVLVVHHEGKDAAKGARGSNALRGAVDVGIRIKREGDGAVVVTVEDQRDGEPLPQTRFKLQNVLLDGIESASAALFQIQGGSDSTDGAILDIAAKMDGATKSKLDAAVAECLRLSRSTAGRRTHDALKIGRELGVRHGGLCIWLDRANPKNRQSALIVRTEQISDVVQKEVDDN